VGEAAGMLREQASKKLAMNNVIPTRRNDLLIQLPPKYSQDNLLWVFIAYVLRLYNEERINV
jgi:hypothetical protein